MNTRSLLLTLTLPLLATLALAEEVPFPQGDFETDPASSWATTGSVTFEDSGGNSFARIAPVVAGSGSLESTSSSPFVSDSIYRVCVDVASSDLVSLGSESLSIQVLDGGDNVVAELNESQLVSLLGIEIGNVTDLTLDLSLLNGLLSDRELVTALLRDLLVELGIADDPDLFAAVEALLSSLVDEDESVLTRLVNLLYDVTEGGIDPGSLTDQDIADILELDELDPVVEDVSDLLDYTAGNEGPVEKFKDLLIVLLGDSGDITDLDIIDDLITDLLNEPDLLESVINVLNLDLVDDVLGTLTQTEIFELLGFADSSETDFQTVKLLFEVGDVVPTGNLKVRLSASTTASAGFTADFDNVTIDQFSLFETPGNVPPNIIISESRPVVRAKRQRVIRTTRRPRIRIRGIARAFGDNNGIARIQVAVRGKGARPKERRFRNKVRLRNSANGISRWVTRVRIPVGTRNRVIFRAFDDTGRKSVPALVRVRRLR